MSNLKPCPFCGGEAEVIFDGDGEMSAVAVKCKDCGIRTIHYLDDTRKAIVAWNRRTERIARVVHSDVFGDWKNMCGNCFEAGKKMGLFHEQKYCYECGCKLDWSDDE